jgi:hypothetical protein
MKGSEQDPRELNAALGELDVRGRSLAWREARQGDRVRASIHREEKLQRLQVGIVRGERVSRSRDGDFERSPSLPPPSYSLDRTRPALRL